MMKVPPVVPGILLVMMNVTLIVAYFFHVGVTVGTVVPQISAVMACISPVFGKVRGVAGAFVAGNIRTVMIQVPAIMINIPLVVPDVSYVLVAVRSILP